MAKRQTTGEIGLSSISDIVDTQDKEEKEKENASTDKSNYYGSGEILPLTEEEKVKRIVLIAFPVVFFIIAVILTAIYN